MSESKVYFIGGIRDGETEFFPNDYDSWEEVRGSQRTLYRECAFRASGQYFRLFAPEEYSDAECFEELLNNYFEDEE